MGWPSTSFHRGGWGVIGRTGLCKHPSLQLLSGAHSCACCCALEGREPLPALYILEMVKRSTAFPSKFCSVNHQLPFVHHSDSCGREDELSHLGTLVSSPPTWKISITSDRSVSPLGSISPTSSFCHPGWGRGPTACHPSTSRLRLPAGARALPRRHDSGSHGPNHLRFCQSMACDRMLPFLFEADSLASLM